MNIINIITSYWLEFLLTTITTGIIYIIKQYISLKAGIKTLLRIQIMHTYDIYAKRGYCPGYMKENITEVYTSYQKLNGNGMATTMVEELYKLPNEEEITKSETK